MSGKSLGSADWEVQLLLLLLSRKPGLTLWFFLVIVEKSVKEPTMYELTQQTSKSGKTKYWGVTVNERFVKMGKKDALFLIKLQENNENHPTVSRPIPIQQRNESFDCESVKGDGGLLSRNEQPSNSVVLPEATRNALVFESNQEQPDQSCAIELHGQKNQELNLKFKTIVQQSFDKSRQLSQRVADANHSLAGANHSLADANHSLADANHSLAAVAYTAIGIAASVTGADVGGFDSGTERGVSQPSFRLEDGNTVNVTSVEVQDLI